MLHYIFLILDIIFFSNLTAQNILAQNELVRINDKTISTDEFLERFEMSPHFNQNLKRITPSVKLDFLYTLITEKLWAAEAIKIGLDTTEAIRTSMESIEKLFVRHALFEKEIRNKIIIPEEKYIKSVIRNSTVYLTKYIYSEDSTEVANIYNSLVSGTPFETLLQNRTENSLQKEPKEIYFGDLIETIEDELFQLNIGEFTKPSVAEDGWYIFNVFDKKEQTFATKEDEQNANKAVNKILNNRIGEKRQTKFYRNFFSEKKVDVNRDLFVQISTKLTDLFNIKDQQRITNSGTLLTLDAYDILKIRNKFGVTTLSKNFIEFENSPVSLNDFLNKLVFDGFQVKERSHVTAYLNTRVKMFIEHELLAREGYKRNLQEEPEVIKYNQMWKDYYLSQSFLSNQIEKEIISDEETKKYFDNKHDVTTKSFKQVKNSLKRELAYAKQYGKLVDTTAIFANNSLIKINPLALNKVQVTNINSFSIRVLGFGGKITAVPMIKPFTEWVKKWISKDNILP
ncbi:MAG: hypothetical protein GY932_15690 [Arcobacter sp.]|nr:hypothetical protein [Arcobacter sp.]